MSNPEDRAPTPPPSAPKRSGAAAAPPRDPMWTIRELLQWTQQKFNEIGIDGARVDAEHLLADAIGCDRMALYVRHDDVVSPEDKATFRGLVKRRLRREPVAYVLGRRGFHALDLELQVDPRVLVPRPDTEHLVDWLLEELDAQTEDATVLDVGTGSGAIGLAIAKARPLARVVACDVSDDALDVARDNATSAEVEVEFVRSDLLESVPRPPQGWTAIVANLPYIPSAEIDELQPEVATWEPRLALDGGDDGLDLIRTLIEQAREALADDGRLYLEHGMGQSDDVQALMSAAGFVEVGVRKDFGQIERVVRGRKPS